METNQIGQGHNFDVQENVPVKRKRGRPRKDQSAKCVGSALVPYRSRRLKHGENVRLPAGFCQRNGNQSIDPMDDPNDIIVGQAVSGVVEAVFDAGLLLTVTVGGSDTALRGVVFKPGHYVPISAENDVAPHVQMIRRNNISRPKENHAIVQASYKQHLNLGKSGTANSLYESPSSNHVSRVTKHAASISTSRGKKVQSMAMQPAWPVESRGNVVPVVLKPVNLSNGVPPLNEVPLVATTQAAAHIAATKGKKVLTATLQGDQQGGTTNDVEVPLLTSKSENSDLTSKMSERSCGLDPLSVQPLQALKPHLHNKNTSAFEPLENHGTDNTTQPLQDHAIENEAHLLQHGGDGNSSLEN